MKKYLVGGLVGAALMLSFNVSAAVESFIGKSVDNEFVVELNGKELSVKALAVEGSSYAPVRVIGEALGFNVGFQDNKVILSNNPKEVIPQVTENTTPTIQTPTSSPIKTKTLTLKEVELKIELAKVNIQGTKMFIESGGGETGSRFTELKSSLAKYEAELVELEKQKAELSK